MVGVAGEIPPCFNLHIMKIHPVNIIFFGLFLCSIGLNILYHESNQRLIYHIQKLEAGPAQGLFNEPNRDKPQLTDEQINELIKQMLEEKLGKTII